MSKPLETVGNTKYDLQAYCDDIMIMYYISKDYILFLTVYITNFKVFDACYSSVDDSFFTTNKIL